MSSHNSLLGFPVTRDPPKHYAKLYYTSNTIAPGYCRLYLYEESFGSAVIPRRSYPGTPATGDTTGDHIEIRQSGLYECSVTDFATAGGNRVGIVKNPYAVQINSQTIGTIASGGNYDQVIAIAGQGSTNEWYTITRTVWLDAGDRLFVILQNLNYGTLDQTSSFTVTKVG